MRLTVIILMSLALAGCGTQADPKALADDATANADGLEVDPNDPKKIAELKALVENNATRAAASAYTPAQLSMICRAGIAAEFGRSHKIMQASAQSDGLIRVTYRRPGDAKLWKNDCKVEGDRIVWRTIDASEGSGVGRWRTGEYDDVLTFKVKGNFVTTSSSDGSSGSETYRF